MSILTAEEKDLISKAVEKAESGTGAEIATAVIRESDDYGFNEMLFALIGGFIVFNLAVLFGSSIEGALSRLFWGFNPAILPYLDGLAGIVSGALFYAIAQLPAVDRLIVSRRKMDAAVQKRALLHFIESGVCNTIDRTGILIFISMLEKKAVILADHGINEKVEPGTWDSIVHDLTEAISGGHLASGIVSSVENCGNILSRHITRRKDDKDELDNRPMEPS